MTTPKSLATLPALFAALLLAIGFGACGKDSDAAGSQPPANDDLPELEGLEIPTQAEADQEAAEQITPANADEEFEKLTNDIMGDG